VSRFVAEVDLDAISANVARLDRGCGDAAVMAVVKADGYGHGMLPVARAAVAGGATWLGVAFAEEALALRADGVDVPILAWLLSASDDVESLVRADVDVSVSALWGLEHAIAAAERAGRVAHVHLKADTGLGRAGATIPILIAASRSSLPRA